MKKSLWRTGMALVTAVVMTAATSGTVAAQSTDAGTQIEYALTSSEVASSVLAGSQAGSFAYYRIAYPGNAAELRVQVRFAQYEGGISPVGFNVYGPGGRVDKGVWHADNACLEITYQEDQAAELLVQVYNYGTATVSYSIAATGLPETTVSDAAVAEVTAPQEPTTAEVAAAAEETTEDEATDVWETVSGTVVGNRGGAFAAHLLASSGDGEDVTVTMTVAPADPSFVIAFGLNVYSPSGELVATATPTGEQGVREATWASEADGSYYLQAYNYSDGVAMYYTLEVAD